MHITRMRQTWVEDIVAVLEHGSVTRAAEALNVSQPAFSRRLRGIEAAFGITLFDRGERPVGLHADVAPLSAHLRRAAAEIRQLETALQIAAGRSSGVVVAAQHALSTLLATQIVERIGLPGPSGGLRLHAADRGDCAAMVRRREADIAVLYRDAEAPFEQGGARVEMVDLMEDLLIPVACPARADTPAGTELHIIAYPADVFLGRLIAERIAPRLPQGTRLRPRAETALTLTALQLAIDGAGVAWVPADLASHALRAGLLSDLSPALPTARLKIFAMRLREGHGRAADRAWKALVGEG